jgi:hypothetical protein
MRNQKNPPASDNDIDTKNKVGNIPTSLIVGCLSKQEARDLLQSCLESGEVIPGRHFRDELAKENVCHVDAWRVLREGCIFDPPEEDLRTGEWKYRIEGHEPDGKWLVIVFCFKQIDRALLITVFSVKTRQRR